LDWQGAKNVEGRHTNAGYSGNILVYVWDGKGWAWLRKGDKPENLKTKYSTQYEGNPLLDETVKYFENMGYTPEFSYWWYNGKRYAAIKNKPSELRIDYGDLQDRLS